MGNVVVAAAKGLSSRHSSNTPIRTKQAIIHLEANPEMIHLQYADEQSWTQRALCVQLHVREVHRR
jgi:hypothetical protein